MAYSIEKLEKFIAATPGLWAREVVILVNAKKMLGEGGTTLGTATAELLLGEDRGREFLGLLHTDPEYI